ncbi:MAG: PAS domain-containing sensor histidine kinase [Chloroflexi bacterium]|nr:PAS domain-containing sensor histidine kinase [Chloroflexota bacterium]MBV9601425.1 PAS domain-containing sensor histidine kinase [Chloroflexota bacterium]
MRRARRLFRPGVGMLCALCVLVPALIGAELVVRGYQERLVRDVQTRASNGLDNASTLFDQERLRTLNNAELSASHLGPLVAQDSPDDLLKATADVRANVLRSTSLVALVDAGGHTLASDPASNLQFATQGDVKTALQGKLAAGWQERTPLALESAAPLPEGDGAVLVAENVDDTLLNTGARLTSLEMALVENGRMISASRGIRRSLTFAADTSADTNLVRQSGDTFERTTIGPDAYYLAARPITLSNGKVIGTLLAGSAAAAVDDATRQARALAFAAAVLGALGAGLVGTLFGRRTARRARQLARVEDELETSRAQADHLSAVLASLTEGVIVADAEHRVWLVNPAARNLLSLPAGDHQPYALYADQLMPTSERVIRSYSSPVRDEVGTALGTVTVLRDTTRDQEVERLKSEFLTVVSHELQTPLTAIKGALELVLDDDTGDLSRVQRRFLDTIDRNCARLTSLVADLLDLSRLEAGRIELETQPLDTASVVRGALSPMSNLFEARGITLRVDVPDGTPPILGDRRRVEQILTNLLSNAAKYTPEDGGGVVDLCAHADARYVELAVADNGPGVPEAERDVVFDRFYRGRDAARRGEAGSGLGLAIVKSLVELHGGSIHVEAAQPRGARFVVALPRAGDEDD